MNHDWSKLTNGGRLLLRGDTFDIEDDRTSYRLRLAHRLLQAQGLHTAWTHSDHEVVEFGRPKHGCDYRCTARWVEDVRLGDSTEERPCEWAGPQTFNAAYAMADAIQTERGNFHKGAAYAWRTAR